MLWRVANALLPDRPMNLDRVLAGSYNTRSVLESLMAHTPQFYYCYPGRIERTTLAAEKTKPGHKHIMWCPDNPHEAGVMVEAKTNIIISEIPSMDVFYDAVLVPPDIMNTGIDIELKRRHSQIQILLVKIGEQLGFRTWVATNDRGIIYKDQRISEMDGVVRSLDDEKLMAFEEARRAALFIDCIWFKNGKLIPAVIEIEHTTGVTSGLTRMKELQDAIPGQRTRYVISAPDEARDMVLRETSRQQFKSLDAKYFPYSAVEELYSLCDRRKIKGVSDEFLDCFMEKTLQLPA